MEFKAGRYYKNGRGEVEQVIAIHGEDSPYGEYPMITSMGYYSRKGEKVWGEPSELNDLIPEELIERTRKSNYDSNQK